LYLVKFVDGWLLVWCLPVRWFFGVPQVRQFTQLRRALDTTQLSLTNQKSCFTGEHRYGREGFQRRRSPFRHHTLHLALARAGQTEQPTTANPDAKCRVSGCACTARLSR
jgi:hypothetical protein